MKMIYLEMILKGTLIRVRETQKGMEVASIKSNLLARKFISLMLPVQKMMVSGISQLEDHLPSLRTSMSSIWRMPMGLSYLRLWN